MKMIVETAARAGNILRSIGGSLGCRPPADDAAFAGWLLPGPRASVVYRAQP